jgi:hypothetical protein
VAFLEVFTQLTNDMKAVQARLKKAETGKVTVAIENDVLATLKEMTGALKRAAKESSTRPRPTPANLLAELKLIHAMQRRINVRTAVYGKGHKGEEVPAPETAKGARERERLEAVRRELKDLAGRQEKVAAVTQGLAGAVKK